MKRVKQIIVDVVVDNEEYNGKLHNEFEEEIAVALEERQFDVLGVYVKVDVTEDYIRDGWEF